MSFEQYLKQLKFSPNTIKRYLSWQREFERYFEGQDFKKLTYNELLDYYSSKEGKRSSKVQLLSRIKNYYKYLGVNNPLASFQLKGQKVEANIHYLSSEELERVYQLYIPGPSWSKAALGLMVYQGLATSELFQLRIEALQLEQGIITLPAQSLQSRELKIAAHQLFALINFTHVKAPRSRLFPELNKNHLHKLTQQVKQSLQGTGIKFENLRQLRASRIRLWIESEGILATKYQAGHKSLMSTQRYQQDMGEQLRAIFMEIHPLF